jgi:hypothetical protein
MAYHKLRMEWWEKEYAEACNKAKASGVEIRQYDVTGGSRAELVLDATLQKRINECHSKRMSHKDLADQMSISAAMYASQADRSYELDGEDVQYFRMAGGPREE